MKLEFDKYSDGLIPAIVQDAANGRVLMLGFMNADALAKTQETQRVSFYSRSRKMLWTKGETSGNFLDLVSITADCDTDTLLITAKPTGPVCHTGADTCFGEANNVPKQDTAFLQTLEGVIAERRSYPKDDSYISGLFADGINKIAQKVGEEAVEVVIASKDNDADAFKNEAADLLFHYLILLNEKGLTLADISSTLAKRHGG